MREMNHPGNFKSGMLRATLVNNHIRIEILPMNDCPYVDIVLGDLLLFINAVRIRVTTGEFRESDSTR